MNYLVTIDLLSDLCSSSGSTNGRMIDTDICFDHDNRPYIPAKRIKGVLLQAYLDYIDITGEEDLSETLFGEEDGEKEVMYVSDAKLLNDNDSETTYYRTQICIDENGITKDGSLRTLMVVKRNVQFGFRLTVDSGLVGANLLNRILSLVTHIGLNRNRGFGEVRLIAKEEKRNRVTRTFSQLDDSKIYRYDILCKAMNDLLLPETNREISGSVIPGSSLYGFFAYHYIQNNRIQEPMSDSNFVDIFYDNGVRFSFGYISNEKGDSFYPLPSCVQKGKNTNPPLYRLTLEANKANLDDSNDKVKYKSLNSKFGILNTSDNTLELKDVDFRFNYHHQRDKEEMGKGLVKDTSFFQYKAILAGQYFKFSLEGKGCYLKALLQNLECLHVGKSRTAQYGALEIDWNHSQYKEISGNSYAIQKGICYLACVESPVILNDKLIDSNVENLDLDLFMNTLNKKYPNLKMKDGCYNLSRKMVSGFNMQWKKSKPSVYAIAPDSYVLLESTENEDMPDVLYIGKKCNEGFGQIRLLPINEKNHALTLKTGKETENRKGSSFDSGLDAKAKAISEVKENKQLENFDSGLLSRMLLMLRQTKDYKEFKENIDKITNKGKKEASLSLLHRFEDYYSIRNKDDVYMPYFFTLLTLIKYDQRKVSKKESKREGE